MDSQTSKTWIDDFDQRHQRAIIFAAATVTRHLFLDVVIFSVPSRVRFRYTPASHSIGITINHPAIGVRASPFYRFHKCGTLLCRDVVSRIIHSPFPMFLLPLLHTLGGKSFWFKPCIYRLRLWLHDYFISLVDNGGLLTGLLRCPLSNAEA
jgi:hypothetical protein